MINPSIHLTLISMLIFTNLFHCDTLNAFTLVYIKRITQWLCNTCVSVCFTGWNTIAYYTRINLEKGSVTHGSQAAVRLIRNKLSPFVLSWKQCIELVCVFVVEFCLPVLWHNVFFFQFCIDSYLSVFYLYNL